jgi:hypothetical protein
MIGVANAPLPVVKMLSKADRFKELKNEDENQRLHRALKWRYLENRLFSLDLIRCTFVRQICNPRRRFPVSHLQALDRYQVSLSPGQRSWD